MAGMASEANQTPLLRKLLVGWRDVERAALAASWGVPGSIPRDAAVLADMLLTADGVAQLLARLPPTSRAAVRRLQAAGGQLPRTRFEQEFGWLGVNLEYPNPRAMMQEMDGVTTATDHLFMCGLIVPVGTGAARAFALPADVAALLPPLPGAAGSLHLAAAPAPAIEAEPYYAHLERHLLMLLVLADAGQLQVIPTGGLNKASLLRLARRWDAKADLQGITREEHWPYIRFLRVVAERCGLLHSGADAGLHLASGARDWLRLPQLERARRLLDAWVESEWDELASLFGVRFDTAYLRRLPDPKRVVLRWLAGLSPKTWYAPSDFVAVVKESAPDFARPTGDYDSWRIFDYYRRPLSGFEHWDAVEGRQLEGMLTTSLYWLGVTDVGLANEETAVAFQVTTRGAALLGSGATPAEDVVEPIIVQPNFEVLAPQHARLFAQFYLARVAELANDDTVQVYKLTKRSIQAAVEHGETIDAILTFLASESGSVTPQNVVATLREWAGQYGRLTLRNAGLLEADDPALLVQVARDKRVRMPNVERLTETTWLVPEGDVAALAERLRKAGYGLAAEAAASSALSPHDLTIVYAALEFYAAACDALGSEHEASAALQRRVARLLSETQRDRAGRASYAALTLLRERLGKF